MYELYSRPQAGVKTFLIDRYIMCDVALRPVERESAIPGGGAVSPIRDGPCPILRSGGKTLGIGKFRGVTCKPWTLNNLGWKRRSTR